MESIAKDLRAYLDAQTGYEVAVSRFDQVHPAPRGPRVLLRRNERTPVDDLFDTHETGAERLSVIVLHETDDLAETVAAEILALVVDYEQDASEFVEGGRTVLAVYVEDQHSEIPEELADLALDWDSAVIELLIQHEA